MGKKSVEGIVVKVTNDKIVLLCQDGTFQNVARSTNNAPPLIGERYTHIEKKTSWLKYTSMASLLLLAFITYLLLPFGKDSSTYVVAIDINPSVELTVNDAMMVVDTSANNSDGEALLAEIEMVEQPLAFAIENIITYSEDAGYFIADKLITTSIIPFKKQKIDLTEEIEQIIATSISNPDLDVVVQRSNKQIYDEAKQSNLSVNQYAVVKELETEGVVKSVEEVKGKSMAELRKLQNDENGRNNQSGNNGKGLEQRDAANKPDGVGRPNDDQEKGTPPPHAEGNGRDKNLPPQTEGKGRDKNLPPQAEGEGKDRGVPPHAEAEKRGNSTPGTSPAHSKGQQNKERVNEPRNNPQEKRAPQSQGDRP